MIKTHFFDEKQQQNASKRICKHKVATFTLN